MTKEEKYMHDAGAWECEQRSPYHIYSVGDHTLAVVKYCISHGASDELIKAAWLHDAGKMEAKSFDGKYDHFHGHAEISGRIAEELGESEYVVKLVRYHDTGLGRIKITAMELAQNGRKWCDDLAILSMADLSGQHPTYRIGERLQQRGVLLQKLYAALDELEKSSQ